MHLNQWSSVHLRTFFCPAIPPIPAIRRCLEVFEAGRSWAECQSLGLRCCPRHPDFQSFSGVMDSWHGTLNIIEHVFKCPIQMSYRFQEFVSQVSHIDIQCLPRSSVVAKSGWASFKLSEGTCLGRSFLERRPPRFQIWIDMVSYCQSCKLFGTQRCALDFLKKKAIIINIKLLLGLGFEVGSGFDRCNLYAEAAVHQGQNGPCCWPCCRRTELHGLLCCSFGSEFIS